MISKGKSRKLNAQIAESGLIEANVHEWANKATVQRYEKNARTAKRFGYFFVREETIVVFRVPYVFMS